MRAAQGNRPKGPGLNRSDRSQTMLPGLTSKDYGGRKPWPTARIRPKPPIPAAEQASRDCARIALNKAGGCRRRRSHPNPPVFFTPDASYCPPNHWPRPAIAPASRPSPAPKQPAPASLTMPAQTPTSASQSHSPQPAGGSATQPHAPCGPAANHPRQAPDASSLLHPVGALADTPSGRVQAALLSGYQPQPADVSILIDRIARLKAICPMLADLSISPDLARHAV